MTEPLSSFLLQLLQALLRSGGMDRPQEADDSQERLRALQLQGLLATLQVRSHYTFASGGCNT